MATLLEDDRLAGLRDLPRRELYDLPDPRLDVLRARARARARGARHHRGVSPSELAGPGPLTGRNARLGA